MVQAGAWPNDLRKWVDTSSPRDVKGVYLVDIKVHIIRGVEIKIKWGLSPGAKTHFGAMALP